MRLERYRESSACRGAAEVAEARAHAEEAQEYALQACMRAAERFRNAVDVYAHLADILDQRPR